MALKDLNEGQKNKISGVGGTIIFHALLLIFLLMTNLTTRVPYPDPGGIEVAMGDPEEGGPDNLPASRVEESNAIPKTNSEPDEQLTTGNDDEAPETEVKKDPKKPNDAIKKSDDPAKTDNNSNTDGKNTTTDKPKKNNPFQLGKNQSDGQGSGDKPGSGGEKWGTGDDPDGNHGKNGGPGGKGSGDLGVAGRTLVNKPVLKSDVQQEERVGVKITVDANGKVVAAKAGFEKSTTTDKRLWREAEELARKIVYSASTDGKSSTAVIVIRFRPQ